MQRHFRRQNTRRWFVRTSLYSAANLDLGPEPIALSVPATDRYFMLPLLSLWTDVFAVPGTRTTGRNTARDFLLVGPGWQGQAPGGEQGELTPSKMGSRPCPSSTSSPGSCCSFSLP